MSIYTPTAGAINLFTPSMFISIYFLLTISIQNQLISCENNGKDDLLQIPLDEVQNSPNLFIENVLRHVMRILPTHLASANGSERVNLLWLTDDSSKQTSEWQKKT